MGLITLACELSCLAAGFVYPSYRSFKAIRQSDSRELTVWLTFWIVMALFTVLASLADVMLFWVPFYYELKLLFVLFLVLPQTGGALYLYKTYVHVYLRRYERDIDRQLAEARHALLRQGALLAVRAYAALAKALQSVVALVTFLFSLASLFCPTDQRHSPPEWQPPLDSSTFAPAAVEEVPQPAGTLQRAVSAVGRYLVSVQEPTAEKAAPHRSTGPTVTAASIHPGKAQDHDVDLLALLGADVFGQEVYGDSADDPLDLMLACPVGAPEGTDAAMDAARDAEAQIAQRRAELLAALSSLDRRQQTLRLAASRRRSAAAAGAPEAPKTGGTAEPLYSLGATALRVTTSAAGLLGTGVLRGAQLLANRRGSFSGGATSEVPLDAAPGGVGLQAGIDGPAGGSGSGSAAFSASESLAGAPGGAFRRRPV